MGSFMSFSKLSMTLWGPFQRTAKFNHKEKLFCVVSGIEHFRMVSFLFKHNMYSGVYSDLNPDETPINMFEKDQK